MKNSERILYVFIIGFQCALILASLLINQKGDDRGGRKILEKRLFSFNGKERTGEKNLVHFTAYSRKMYVFLVLSSNCRHCEMYIDNVHELETKLAEMKNVEAILLLNEEDERIVRNAPSFRTLHVADEDLFQFGTETPSLLVVNGKGEILFKQIGYSQDLFKHSLKVIKQNTEKRSKKL